MENTQGLDYDAVKEKVTGVMGYASAIKTVASKSIWFPTAEYIIETIRYQEPEFKKDKTSILQTKYALFLRWIGPAGSGRIVLPEDVMDTIYKQRQQVITKSRKNTARRVHATLKAKGEALANNHTEEANGNK
jgi:hypothetical protein